MQVVQSVNPLDLKDQVMMFLGSNAEASGRRIAQVFDNVRQNLDRKSIELGLGLPIISMSVEKRIDQLTAALRARLRRL
jgi:hypothetical protein